LFLHGAATDLACYRDGEPVRLLTRVSSFGPERQSVRVHFRIEPGLPDSGHGQVFAETRELTLNPGATVEAAAEWRPDRFGADFYSVEVKLDRGRDDASFEPWDVLRTGFVVWNQEVLRQGFPVRLHRNYFMDTTGRSRFLTGTNQTGMVWFSENENPLVWARDFEAMRDNGLRLLRFLHFSPFAAQGYEGKGQHTSLDLGREPPLRLQRQTDALVQLLQKHGVACFLSLHDWVGVELTDAELEAQRIWAEFWTRRYREVPGMFYDVQNEPSVSVPEAPHVVALWNDWLVARHGSRQNAWQAWAGTGEPPAAFDVKPGPGTWDDLKSLDLNLFKTVLLNRWARANRQGIKAGAPEALLTIGYLPSQPPADKLLGAAEVDFSNTHYYGSQRDFLLQFKFIDRRFEGKSLSVGEFGAQVNHDARVNGQTGDRAQASAEWFLLVTHGAFALGGSFVANWDWKEFQDCVFPWGIRYADLNPKPVAGVYRCAERLLGSVAPFYRSPAVYLVVPDSHRLGATSHEVHAGVCRALDLLLQCQVDFGVVNEWALTGPGQGVPETRALMWPLPYCPDDATFDCLRSWVEAGGCLYVSGDVQFDARRQPTRADRRAQLGLPAVEPRPPHETPAERWTQPPLTVPVGQGKVFYVAAPVELREQPANRDLYLRFLEWAGVARVPLGPDNRALVTGTLPLEDGGVAWVVLNTGSDHATVTWAGPAPVTLNLGARRTGFAAFDGRGSLRALEAQGEARVADTPVVTGDGHWMLLAEGPDADLRRPTACLLMALTPGTYVLPSLAAAPCAWEAEFRVPKAGQSAVLARHPLERRPGNWVLTVPPELVASEVLLRAK
jgi:hypothetical protein